MRRPILLCHGVCRFDVLWARLPVPAFARSFADKAHYFRGVGSALEREGFPVVRASVGWADGVHARARQLRREIERALKETGADKVHLVAHSMGGLDARRLLFADRDDGRIHRRVASLVTLGTPHKGSPIADAIAAQIEGHVDLERFLPAGTRALLDLRTEACTDFDSNPDVRAFEDALAEDIVLRSYAGRWTRASGSLMPAAVHRICREAAGDGDGVVPISSARWRDDAFVTVWDDTDHINLIGRQSFAQSRSDPPDQFLRRVHDRYVQIARSLPD